MIKRYPLVQEKTAVVTGASSGIGRAAARVLLSRGWRVFATARKAADLAALREEGFLAVEMDLAVEGSAERAAAEILSAAGERGVEAVVNNAGYGQPGALEDVPREAFREQLETNVLGPVEFTRRFIPAMRARRRGRVVLVSSVVGRVVIPFMGAYCASKFAVEAVGDEWRMELGGDGISVSLVEPGPVASSFRQRTVGEAGRRLDLQHSVFALRYAKDWGTAERTFSRPTDVFRKGPEAVAAKIVHALESRRPHARYPVTAAAWLGAVAARILPARVQDWILTSAVIGRSVEKTPAR